MPRVELPLRLAFVVQTHKNLGQIARLVKALATGNRPRFIVISHDGTDAERAYLAGLPNVSQVLAAPGGRGSFGLIDGLLQALRWLDAQPDGYDWLITLSGQDYPIRPISQLEHLLAASPHDGMFYHFPVDAQPAGHFSRFWWPPEETRSRYFFKYLGLKPSVSPLERALLKIPRMLAARTKRFRLDTSYGLNIGWRAAAHPFGDGFKLHGGSFWLVLRRRGVRELWRFIDERADVVDYFRQVLIPDESFIPTVLGNCPRLNMSTTELHYFDFTGSRHGHPKIVDEEDVRRALDVGCYFIRKIDTTRTPRLIDRIDEHLLGLPAGTERVNSMAQTCDRLASPAL